MKFIETLGEGHFIRRYKRFFADIQWNGEIITAHVPNTGSLRGCLMAGSACRFTVNKDSQRKLKYTLQMIKVGRTWVGVNTHISNLLVGEIFEKRTLLHWKSFQMAKREVALSDSSRVDFVFWKDKSQWPAGAKKINPLWFRDTQHGLFHFVEVKNVTLKKGPWAQFPDAVTSRGQKHLRELIELVKRGHSAEIFFTVQRGDCRYFSPAGEIDPEYGRLLRKAKEAGVTISAYACRLNPQGITINPSKQLQVDLR